MLGHDFYDRGKYMYLVSVYFDKTAEHILQRYINKIAEKTGNSFMTDNNVPPHMTISAIEARSENVLLGAMDNLQNSLGKTLTKEQMQMAFSVMQESFVPFEAAITEIGLARVNPHSDVVRWELKQHQ